MTDVETKTDDSQVLIIKVLEIMNKTGKKWKYKVNTNRHNEIVMQTNIEPRDFPVTLKVGRKYLIPIIMNKSGKVANVDGRYMELIVNYEEDVVIRSTIPLEEQGGTKEQIDLITKGDVPVMDNEPAPPYKVPKVITEALDTKPPANDKLAVDKKRKGGVIMLNVDAIIEYLCPTATKQEAFKFLQLCENQGLDPFVGDAYLIKWGNKAQMVVAKDAFLKKAEAMEDYEGFEAGVMVMVNEDPETIDNKQGSLVMEGYEILVGGWSKVFRKNMKPFYSEVSFDEYTTKKNLWLSKPATMIRKVALVQAMREAFPASFQGMYDRSELDVEENKQ